MRGSGLRGSPGAVILIAVPAALSRRPAFSDTPRRRAVPIPTCRCYNRGEGGCVVRFAEVTRVCGGAKDEMLRCSSFSKSFRRCRRRLDGRLQLVRNRRRNEREQWDSEQESCRRRSSMGFPSLHGHAIQSKGKETPPPLQSFQCQRHSLFSISKSSPARGVRGWSNIANKSGGKSGKHTAITTTGRVRCQGLVIHTRGCCCLAWRRARTGRTALAGRSRAMPRGISCTRSSIRSDSLPSPPP